MLLLHIKIRSRSTADELITGVYMNTDPDLDRELADIANPRPEEIQAEQRIYASVRWNEIWFLCAGFGVIFGLGFFLLMIA